MKKITQCFLIPGVAFALILPTTSCGKKGCTDPIATNYDEKAKKDDESCEYVMGCMNADAFNYNADATKDDGNCIEDFSGWDSWMLELTHTGAALGGQAHMQGDSNSIRKIYFKDGQDKVSGKYPEGTMIVKHAYLEDNSGHEYTAMAKRYAGFNTDNNDWEWFTLNADGTIKTRGKNLMSGACGTCHNFAGSGKDYVFSKS